MKKAALIVAGGTGTRMGGEIPKQFLLLAGKPVLIRTLEVFLAHDPKMPVVIVLHTSCTNLWESTSHNYLSESDRNRIFLCEGGKERTSSVYNGLKKLYSLLSQPDEYLVAIQDGVRPMLTDKILDNCFSVASASGASVACVPVTSSLREKKEGGSISVDRSRFFEVQTPQTFRLAQLLQCYHQRPHDVFTDDASLFDFFGYPVSICEGAYDNIKLTTPEDMFLAEQILEKRSKA